MKLRILFGFLICAGIAGVFYVLWSRSYSIQKEEEKKLFSIVRFEAAELRVKVVSTPPETARGLGGVTSLPEDRGMLFLFGAPRKYSIWMKDMRFPLDVIWMDENKKIIDIAKDVRPESYPAYFMPHYPAQYVLEVNAGWANRHQIKIGDVAEFSL